MVVKLTYQDFLISFFMIKYGNFKLNFVIMWNSKSLILVACITVSAVL